MRKLYRKIDDVWASPWGQMTANASRKTTDRVLHSTRLEDGIYTDCRDGDMAMDALEAEAQKKLSTFPALSRDIYQAFYSLMPKRNEEAELSGTAKRFNSKILDHMMSSEEFPTIKNICEGRELPAYEAATEFVAHTAGELDELLADFGGEKNALKTLEKLQNAEKTEGSELAALLDRLRSPAESNITLQQAAINAANKAESKRQQVEAVSKMVNANTAKNKKAIAAIISRSAKAAVEKAKQVQSIIAAWSDEPGNMGRTAENAALLEQVRANQKLRDIAKYLGRFREIVAQGKKNTYAYGRGEKYSLELGNDITRALTSELAMLAAPITVPLFLRKYQKKQIKQYQRREPVYKGMGDIICCLDESGSTKGDAEAWGKAVALALLDIAADRSRSFALIHFSGSGNCKTDIFRPDQYTLKDKTAAAECFLDGGTDYVTPLTEAIRLMETERFENADVVFITDGFCELPKEFADVLSQKQQELSFRITGILLDIDIGAGDFSLKPLCQTVFRTSEFFHDDIMRELIYARV